VVPATLTQGEARWSAWRKGVERESGPSGDQLLAAVRAALADDLDTPTALELVDTWAARPGDDRAAPALVRNAVDALLGVQLPSR
jgi:L-cysteine:1D-myo-inositol 2-amino-2-deoxy-alpha-D-glucopyranoside ligase